MSKHIQALLTVVACLSIACAEDTGLSAQQLPTMPEDAEAAAHDVLSETLALHTAIHAIYARAKGELAANPRVLLDELVREPWKDSTWGLWGAFDARDELNVVMWACPDFLDSFVKLPALQLEAAASRWV